MSCAVCFSSLLLFGTSCGPQEFAIKIDKSQMKHSRRRAFIKCGKYSMCTYDRFKVHKMLYPKMHSKPTTQTWKGCTIPIGTSSMAVYLPEPYYWISCKLCLSAKSTPFHWLLICFIGASPDWPISLVHQPAMTLNVTRTCMKPCNIPLSLGPKKRKGTPWFNAAFTCHVLRVLVGPKKGQNEKTVMPCRAVQMLDLYL